MYGLFGKFGSKEFAQKKGDVIYCEDDDDELMLNVLRCHLTY